MTAHIFVIGLDPFNHEILKRISARNELIFHPLLHYHEIRGSDLYPVQKLLQTCRERVNRFKDPVTGIIGYFDFPSTDLVPIICREYGLPGASVESVMKIENKLWARMEQIKVIPAYIPKFIGINPETPPEVEALGLSFPFWIKPVRSFKSYLAFKITDAQSYHETLASMKARVENITSPFRRLMSYAAVGKDFTPYLFHSCIAEEMIPGHQCTVEGYVYDNHVTCYGIVDSIRDRDMSPLVAYEYPSRLPLKVQEEIIEVSTRIITHLEYNNATFNIEYFYAPETDALSLLEINPRCSQSHAPLFEKVDGVSNLAVMVDLAMGRNPVFEKGGGPFSSAGKYMVRSYENGRVTKLPSREDVERLRAEIGDIEIKWHIRTGTQLSHLYNQDSYTYEIMDIYLGGTDPGDLREKYARCLDRLQVSMDICFRPIAGP